MTREELRDYVEEQRSLGVIPYHIYSTLIDGIDTLEQEPKMENKGEWIWDEDGLDWGLGAWRCSKCRRKPETWWESAKKINPLRCAGSRFCGNCGADMRGKE